MRILPFSAVVVLLLAVWVPGCGRPPGQPTASEVPIVPQQIRDFATLYRLNCAGCHGVDGRGNGALALANPVYLAIADDAVLRRATAQGVPGTLMPAFAVSSGGMLTDEQIGILVAGIRKFASGTPPLTGDLPPPYSSKLKGDPRRGAEVFGTFCASCHGANGQGAGKLGSIVDPSFLALVSDQNLRNTIIAGRPDSGHPDWRHALAGRALTDAQVTELVAWLASHRVTDPGQPYAKKP